MNASAVTTVNGTAHDARNTGHITLRIAGGASVVAGLVHYAAVPEHRAEWLLAALFFTIIGAFQVLWPVLVHVCRRRALWWAALAVNLGLLALWLISRTAGLPFGPEAGDPEPVGVLDTIASAAELITVAALLMRPRLLPWSALPAESPAE